MQIAVLLRETGPTAVLGPTLPAMLLRETGPTAACNPQMLPKLLRETGPTAVLGLIYAKLLHETGSTAGVSVPMNGRLWTTSQDVLGGRCESVR